MYDELVKRLRERAAAFDYDGWVETAIDCEKAAVAIEKLGNWWAQADKLIQMLEMPRWIPVTVALPENDGWYLVYAPDYRGGSSSGLKCVGGKMFCKFAKGKWSIEHGYYNRPGCVTHWMPLPEPPKEK